MWNQNYFAENCATPRLCDSGTVLAQKMEKKCVNNLCASAGVVMIGIWEAIWGTTKKNDEKFCDLSNLSNS